MRGNLKVLGLAFVAMLAMSAFTASAAQALTQGQFTADGYPAVAHGTEEGEANFLEATPGSKIECDSTYEATLSGPSTKLTVTPHYTNCPGGRVVDLNGCHFEFSAGTNTSASDTHGTAAIICPVGKQIEVTVILFGSTICAVDIPAQSGLTGVTFTNVANGDVTVDVDITNQIKYQDTDISGLCPFSGNQSHTDGDFVSTVLMQGFQDAGHYTTTTGTTGYKAGVTTNIDVR